MTFKLQHMIFTKYFNIITFKLQLSNFNFKRTCYFIFLSLLLLISPLSTRYHLGIKLFSLILKQVQTNDHVVNVPGSFKIYHVTWQQLHPACGPYNQRYWCPVNGLLDRYSSNYECPCWFDPIALLFLFCFFHMLSCIEAFSLRWV